MDAEEKPTQWKTGYTIGLALAIGYILLLGLFTWFFNYSL